MLAVLAGGSLWATAFAQDFPGLIELGSLDGTDGFIIDGEAGNNLAGRSVSAAGDINNDGIADLLIGAPHFTQPFGGGSEMGRTYVLFGRNGSFGSPFALSTIDSSNGSALDGEFPSDQSGHSVGNAGDVDDDGIDDLIVGANGWANGERTGRSYVVLGRSFSVPASSRALANLDGVDGFELDGEVKKDESGFSVSGIGDFNRDGVDDVIIGAPASSAANFKAGRSYVVFGKAGGLASPLDLATLDGRTGFKFDGDTFNVEAGYSVGGAGDINGDGFDDVIIGAPLKGGDSTSAGRSFIVFGTDKNVPPLWTPSDLNGDNGFVVEGPPSGSAAGYSVSAAGDVNSDGIDDIIIGAPEASISASGSGSAYVVFGRARGFPASVRLTDLNGSNGFRLDGDRSFDRAGESVAGAGDVNGDGIDDVIVGASNAYSNGIRSGHAYVVFGRPGGFSATIPLASLDGSNGFKLRGEMDVDRTGISVSGIGDINNDGFDDIAVGADGFDKVGDPESGRVYVIFGRATSAPVSDGPTILFVDSFEN